MTQSPVITDDVVPVASDRFHVGQRVKMTDKAIASGLNGRLNRTIGVVIGFPSRPLDYTDYRKLVKVRRDEQRTTGTYHMDFWEPLVDAVPEEANTPDEDEVERPQSTTNNLADNFTHCVNCGSARFDLSEPCWRCVTAHRELLMRLDRRGDLAVSWATITGWATHGVEGPRRRRWRIG